MMATKAKLTFHPGNSSAKVVGDPDRGLIIIWLVWKQYIPLSSESNGFYPCEIESILFGVRGGGLCFRWGTLQLGMTVDWLYWLGRLCAQHSLSNPPKQQQVSISWMSQIIHTTQYITTSLCYMISVYLKYSSANVFFLIKNKQISQLVAYIVSKKEGSIHQSLFIPPQHLCSLFESSGRGLGQALAW